MNVLYTVDDNFIPQLATSICSLCENNQKMERITFYVFSDCISADNQTKLRSFIKQYGRNLEIIDIAGFMDKLGFDFDTSGWNEIVMARLLMDRFLPDHVERVLYLDGDTLIRGSLDVLWETNLAGKVLAASMEPTADRKRRNQLGLNGKPYYNAGVLLCNLEAWRSLNIEQRILTYCNNNRDHLFANDQDAINAVLSDLIVPISPSYNYFNVFSVYPYSFLHQLMDSFQDESTFNEARNNPRIIHYLGEERPWRDGNHHEYRDDYLFYLAKTPWAETPLEQGWKPYFAAWNAFNVVTNPFPKLRYRIINGLIPLFIQFRKTQRKPLLDNGKATDNAR